jgi:hypothetical protein
MAHHEGFGVVLVNLMFEFFDEFARAGRLNRVNVNASGLKGEQLTRDGRIFVRGGQNGIARFPIQ